jgi:putative Mg2+ transporter-C (MgtC) family protein
MPLPVTVPGGKLDAGPISCGCVMVRSLRFVILFGRGEFSRTHHHRAYDAVTMPSQLAIFGRVAVGFALGFAIGWEREVRGASAGDRTFALVTSASAAVVAVYGRIAPNTIAGVMTGVGFIGGGLVLRSESGMVKGITTAATIWMASAIGVVAGSGDLLLAALIGVLTLITLEFRYIPGLRALDARRHMQDVTDDSAPPGM